MDDIHVINCENNRRGFSSVGSYGFELNSSNFAVQLHKRSANNAKHIDWVTFFIIQMLFLEVKFLTLKADIAGSRLHKVVIALVIVRLGGGG